MFIVIEKETKYTSRKYFDEYDSNKSGGKKVQEKFGLSFSSERTRKEVNQTHLTNSCKYNRYHTVCDARLSINIDALYSSLLIVSSSTDKYTVSSPGHENTSKRHKDMSTPTTTSMQRRFGVVVIP